MRIPTALAIAMICGTDPLAAQGTGVLRLRAQSEVGTPLENTLVRIPQLRVTRFTDFNGGFTLESRS